MEKRNILVTGLPRVGKTTLIQKLSDELEPFQPVGFYTAEIKEQGVRKGFELIGFDGKKGILSHVDIRSPFKVGKYGVDINSFEDFLLSTEFFAHQTRLIIIDEIGKMECFSGKFKAIMEEILNSDKSVIATIAFKGSGFIKKVKKREDVKLIEITRGNRNSVLPRILSLIKEKV